MAKITYVEFSGVEHELDVLPGITVMQGAVGNGLRGIIGDCGGACSCATCHVYIDPAWIEKLEEKSDLEEMLLEEVCDPQPNSRLSCQINITEELDGLVIHLPEKQI